METVYLICAVLGGTLLVCQFAMTLIGVGDHHDVGGHDGDVHDPAHAGTDHDHDTSWLVGIITFRTLVAALTFFGLAGMAASANKLAPPVTLAVALGAGSGAMYAVAMLMRALHNLRAEGTARIERAMGLAGTVYLSIPAQKAGTGKVQLNLQNRTVEYRAITPDHELPTGSKVVVVGIIGPDTVEVVSATESERLSHV